MARAFQPVLSEYIKKHPEVSVVYVSSDRDEEQLATHQAKFGSTLHETFQNKTDKANEWKKTFKVWSNSESDYMEPLAGHARNYGLPTIVLCDEIDLKCKDSSTTKVLSIDDMTDVESFQTDWQKLLSK